MLPYQIYQALTDEHVRELQAQARRHDLVTAARRNPADLGKSSSRLKNAAGRLLAVFRVRDARTSSATTSATGAGPMGCVA